MIGEHGKDGEASTNLSALHGRLVELSIDHLHCGTAGGFATPEEFDAYARTALLTNPGQVATQLYLLAGECDDDRLAVLAGDIRAYQLQTESAKPSSCRAASCADTPHLRPLPAGKEQARS